MKNKTTILIIENSIHVTGALKSITRSAFDLKDKYNFIFIIPARSQGRSWIERKGFTQIYELPFVEISRRISSLVLYLPLLLINGFRISKIVRDNSVSLIHVNDLYNLAVLSAKIFGCAVPYVTYIRFLPDKFPAQVFNFWLDAHLRFASKLVCVSHFLKNMLPPNDKITVIHNELPVEERYPLGVAKHEVPTILYLSNVIKGKGHQYAIEAFARLHREFPQWRLRFAGGDMGMKKNQEYRDELKNLSRQKGIDEKTTWIDFVEDVELEYKKAHLVLNFSESESFSITCLEALYYGLPIIATRSGGPAEIIDDKETGLLVANGNVEEMVSAMRILLPDEDLRAQLAANGRVRVREKFSVEKTSFKLSNCYESILGR